MTTGSNPLAGRRFADERGNPVVPGSYINEGGEGWVYMVDGDPGSVMKIWKPGRAPDDAHTKLRYLVRNPVAPELGANWRITWPERMVMENGVIAGYIMPKLDYTLPWTPVINYYNRSAARGTGADQAREIQIDDRVRIASNLALGYKAVHEAGYVIGDINEKNAEANRQNDVALMDCDSYGFTDPGTGQRFSNNMGRPEFQAPESQGDYANRTQEQDLFALAVLIFQLLTGYHPYTVTGKHAQDYPESGPRISNWLFPPADRSLTAPGPYNEAWEALTDKQKELCHRCFSRTYQGRPRPKPEEWVEALQEIPAVATPPAPARAPTPAPPPGPPRVPGPAPGPPGQSPAPTPTPPTPAPRAAPTVSRPVRLAIAAGLTGVVVVIVSWMFVGGFFFGSDSPTPTAPAAAAPPVPLPVAPAVQATNTPVPTDTPPPPTDTPAPAGDPNAGAAAVPAVVLDPLALSLSKTTAVANDTFIIEGRGFAPDAAIPVANFTINGAPLDVTDASAQGGTIHTDSAGRFTTEARLWPLSLPGKGEQQTYTVMVQDSQGNVIESPVAILPPTMTLSAETARPLDHITVSGENWPLSTRDREFQVNISADGSSYHVPIDHNGRFTHEIQLSSEIALGAQHDVVAVLNVHNGYIDAASAFHTPTPGITLSSAMAAPGDAITLELVNMPLDSAVHEVSIAGIDLLAGLSASTDHEGSAVINGLLIPSVNEGFHDVRVVVGRETVTYQLAVLPDPATPTPRPYPDPVLMEQRGSLPSQLGRAHGVGQYVAGCFVGSEPRQDYWIYLADRPSATLENARNPILLQFHKTIPKDELREVIPGKCYYVGPILYRSDLKEFRCPGSVYSVACDRETWLSRTFPMYDTDRPLHEITEPPDFSN